MKYKNIILSTFVTFSTVYAPSVLTMMTAKQLAQIQQTVLTDTFFGACEEGAVDVVSHLIQKGFNVNTKAHDDLTPLHIACGNSHLDIVKLLVKNKAKINAVTCGKKTPLFSALASGNIDIIEFLALNGANINEKYSDNNTMLHYACGTSNIDIVKILVTHKAIVNVEGWKKITPLHYAVIYKNIAIIKYLLEAGANINAETTNGLTALDCLYDQEDPTDVEFSIMELFEKHGAIILSNEEAEEYGQAFFTKLNQETSDHESLLAKKTKPKNELQTNVQHGKNWKKNQRRKEKQKLKQGQINTMITSTMPVADQSKIMVLSVTNDPVLVQPNLIPENKNSVDSNEDDSLKSLSWSEDEDAVKPNDNNNVLAEAQLQIKLTNTDCSMISSSNSAIQKPVENIVLIPTTSTIINNKSPVVSKNVTNKTSQQQSVKSTKTQIKSNMPIQVTQPVHTNNKYQVIYPKKWPRSLSRESQKNTMFNHLKQLKEWPNPEGLDIERLQGQMKGNLCIRVGGHRIIFKVDEKNHAVMINEIALHHDGYKK